MFFYLLSVHWRNYLVKPDGKDTSFLLIIYQFYLKKEKMLVVLHISIQRTSIFKKLLLAYGEDINIFVFDSKAPNWDNFQTLTSSSSVTIRQCSNTFSIALAAPSVPRR